jgi:hypothetical protein
MSFQCLSRKGERSSPLLTAGGREGSKNATVPMGGIIEMTRNTDIRIKQGSAPRKHAKEIDEA